MKIFVSYTTRDNYINRVFLEKVSKILSEYCSHYIDLLHNDAADKQLYVEEMLKKADAVLLFNSKSIGKSEWVQWELSEANRIGIPVICIEASIDQNKTIQNLKLKLKSEHIMLTRRSSKDALTRAA